MIDVSKRIISKLNIQIMRCVREQLEEFLDPEGKTSELIDYNLECMMLSLEKKEYHPHSFQVLQEEILDTLKSRFNFWINHFKEEA